MESFHIPNSHNQNCQKSYEFSPEDLANIPCPDDSFPQAESSPSEDDIELPLPPGTSGDDFLTPLSPKKHFLHHSNDIFPSLPPNKAFNNASSDLLVSENVIVMALDRATEEKPDVKSEEFQLEDGTQKLPEILDDSKYSPSKMDSDEENSDFITIKPKVLGKEQAKKRLMAFSLSKQPSSSIKKQSKATILAKNKEKPPNPNKSSNVQEQFRATISAIEEEKKKMFLNMPSYLLLEMSELAKSSHTSMSSSLEVLEKLKNENTDSKNKNSSKNRDTSSEKRKSKSFHKSRSRSHSQGKTKKRRRSRSKSRSRSMKRSKRSLSRSRRRSHSRSRSRTSRNRRLREENNVKADKMSRESQIMPSKKLIEDWNSFKSAGLVLERESWQSKNRLDESKPRREEHSRRSRTPSMRPEFKPIFNYLTKGHTLMNTLQAKPADPGSSVPISFPEKIIKYTRKKPILCWAENPSLGTEFYMSKQMLLENCDEITSSILLTIIENTLPLQKETLEAKTTKSRSWYPRECFFLTIAVNTHESLEKKELHLSKRLVGSCNIPIQESSVEAFENKEEMNSNEEDKKTEGASVEKKISLVNDSYLSEEEDQVKEMMVGNVKVQLDLDMNSVKVRSKWDSDYEAENSEKESALTKDKSRERLNPNMIVRDIETKSKEKLLDEFDVAPCQAKSNDFPGKKTLSPSNKDGLNIQQVDAPNLGTSDATTGNLVSEYEEFLKMVSVDSNDHLDNQKKKIPESKSNLETQKIKKTDKSNEENQQVQTPKFGLTEWDQESDHEEESNNKNLQFIGSHDEFLILGKNEKLNTKLDRSKKKPTIKKTDKIKIKKKKILKKFSKAKKKKCENSVSEDSTSESYESDSDSDSEESKSTKKKKKKRKKISKSKNKSKKSSSESDSESDDNNTKKRRAKKKKSGKKKSSSSSSNDSAEETQNALLKQLDFKKQLIIKKIEEIDSISDRSSKKKEKENHIKKREKESSEETDSENYTKSDRKKNLLSKSGKKKSKTTYKKSKILGKNKKLKESKSSSDSESDSESSEESVKKKKNKKLGKKNRDSSHSSSDSEEKPTKLKLKPSDKDFKKNRKNKKDGSLSKSDNSEDSLRDRKKSIKKGSKVKSDGEEAIGEPIFEENLLLDNLNLKSTERLEWENKKLWKKSEGKNKKKKEDGDWEASSSLEELQQECKTRESSWDEEAEVLDVKTHVSEDCAQKSNKEKIIPAAEKEFGESNSTNMSEANKQLASETLKTSLSNFSFNENSFCSFGQELSRDFFLAERSYSNSGNIKCENLRPILIEPRPFQSVSKDSEVKKPADSELYSPGYSDSEFSEVENNKSEKVNTDAIVEQEKLEEVYDPLNCDSEASAENNEIELSSIPLPRVSDILLPGETKNVESTGVVSSPNSENIVLKNVQRNESEISVSKLPSMTSPLKSSFVSVDFTPVIASRSSFNDDKNSPTKRQLMSVKGQQKLVSKAASVFQDESDEEYVEPLNKLENIENIRNEIFDSSKDKVLCENERKKGDKNNYKEDKNEIKSRKRESRDRSNERDKRRRSRSRERRGSNNTYNKKIFSPNKRRRSRTPEVPRGKREIRSDSFEIEPLKSSFGSSEMTHMVHPIPVLMGVEASSSEGMWGRTIIPGCEFPQGGVDNFIDQAESFDIYPPEESRYRNRNYDEYERVFMDNLRDGKNKKERGKSRSQSSSPRKKIRSKSPERRKSPRTRSPRRKSMSPKRRDKSPFSPRRRSPKRKSPSRRYKSSRSPDHKRKSASRSPRKKRSSPSKRSRSGSPRKYWSPKHRDDSPKKKDSPLKPFSPGDRFSPQKDPQYGNSYSTGLQNRIPVIGASTENMDIELSPSAVRSPFDNTLAFHRQIPDSSLAETDMYNSFYEGEYSDEFGVSGYSEEVGVNNLITIKSHEVEKGNSPERLSLDQRIELELRASMSGSQAQNDQYQMPSQVCPSFQEMNSNHFQNSYNCENTTLSSDNYYQNPNAQINSDFNGQYFNGHQQQPSPSYGTFQQYSSSQTVQNSVLQVGNIVEVVPALQHPPPPPPPLPSKTPQIMQVGNVLQVVPSQKATPPVPPMSHNYTLPDATPMVKTQKATAVVAPSSIVPTPNPETVLNPLIKAIQLEREKRKKEKEKRKAERELRRKARQLRREAKLMSVNEKLKKSVQNEGLMLGQEVEDDDLLDALDVPSPPIPVEIITVSSPSVLPPAGKGILITAGFIPKPPSEKKEVKFADGVCPGEGTSTSGGEDVASPPPKPILPKEKRFKKKKTKVKKKVKVQIIRQIVQEDDDEDDLSPPPPPPGDPPPVFFARFPFPGDAQFPVYQTQTTTTTLTTIQYPAQSFE